MCCFVLIFFVIGSHTYDAIARLLDNVIEEYALQGKICHMVTDNGSAFVKAFKEYSVIINWLGIEERCTA